jgi:hypothetical protein
MKKKIHLLPAVILAFGFLVLFSTPSVGQKSGSLDTSPKPLWVKMMDDPNANYFAVNKEFEKFWKGKEKPTEEKEIFGNYEKTNVKEARLSKSAEAVEYTLDYKRFLNWQREVAPYVQADGRILNIEERIQLWQQEKKNRDDAEAKAKKGNDN